MEINVEKLAKILSKEEGVSFGTFDLNDKPAVGVMFVRAEHIPTVKKFAEDMIDRLKASPDPSL